jgi:hypothetical protein
MSTVAMPCSHNEKELVKPVRLYNTVPEYSMLQSRSLPVLTLGTPTSITL